MIIETVMTSFARKLDNKRVLLLSNFDSVYLLRSAQRYNRKEKREYQCLHWILSNATTILWVVLTDMLDSRLELYHCREKGKMVLVHCNLILKCWWPIRFCYSVQQLRIRHWTDLVSGEKSFVSWWLTTIQNGKDFETTSSNCAPLVGSLRKRRRCQVSSCPRKCSDGGGAQVFYQCIVYQFPCHIECYNDHVLRHWKLLWETKNLFFTKIIMH